MRKTIYKKDYALLLLKLSIWSGCFPNKHTLSASEDHLIQNEALLKSAIEKHSVGER